MGKKTSTYKILVGKPEEKEPLGIPRLKLHYNIKMDLRVREWGVMD
jgi:hypothetical protein